MITTVLFDLDGTLLPMDNDEFTRYYFNLLAKKMAAHGFEPEELIKGIWIGKEAMVNNDGSKSNEEAFWEGFTTIFGSKVRELESEFLEFYKNEFNEAKVICSPTEDANKVVKLFSLPKVLLFASWPAKLNIIYYLPLYTFVM